jgi:uncharacterized protein
MNTLSARDRHLFGPGPKRILSLDGGGVRGALTIAFLERLEEVLEEIEGRPIILGDWFDLIGGTSTGAIIAVALALGYRARDIHKFYSNVGPRIFRHSFWRIAGIRAKFDGQRLVEELGPIVGSRTFESEDLLTGFCLVTKRMDTGSSWAVSNNPRSLYWDTPTDKSYIGNRHFPLANLIRASAAAPYFFDPEPILIVPQMPPGIFLDGGMTPHNNPALYLLFMATMPQYGLCWPLGAQNLTIVSVGTGSFRPTVEPRDLRWLRPIGLARNALTAQISEGQQLVLTLMSWMGESPTSWVINSELGDMSSIPCPYDRPLFRFLRYDLRLEAEWMQQELGITLDKKSLQHFRRLDAAENIPQLFDMGMRAAARQIRREHFKSK